MSKELGHPPTCPEGTSLVGCLSHVITVERHKVAWGKINPKLRNLAIADYGERKSNLFGPGFLEKASKLKRLETEKTLAKVSGTSQCPFAKKPRYDSNKSNHRSFVSKGASVRCRNARGRHKQPHTFSWFRGRGYYQGDQSQKFHKDTTKTSFPKDKPDK